MELRPVSERKKPTTKTPPPTPKTLPPPQNLPPPPPHPPLRFFPFFFVVYLLFPSRIPPTYARGFFPIKIFWSFFFPPRPRHYMFSGLLALRSAPPLLTSLLSLLPQRKSFAPPSPGSSYFLVKCTWFSSSSSYAAPPPSQPTVPPSFLAKNAFAVFL